MWTFREDPNISTKIQWYTLIPKPDKDATKKKLQSNNTNKHRCKKINKILANQMQQNSKKIIHLNQVDFVPVMQGFFNIHKSVNKIHHINPLKKKKSYDFLNKCRGNL